MEKLNEEEFNCLLEKISEKGSGEWSIEKVLTFDGFVSDYDGDKFYQEWEEMLIDKSVKKEYFHDTILIAKGNRLKILKDKMYFKKDFNDVKWEKIEQLLVNKEKPHTFSNTSSNEKLFAPFICALALGIIVIVFYKRKRK